jgi:hypothetical protein
MLMEGIVSFLSKMIHWRKLIKLVRLHDNTLNRVSSFPWHVRGFQIKIKRFK